MKISDCGGGRIGNYQANLRTVTISNSGDLMIKIIGPGMHFSSRYVDVSLEQDSPSGSRECLIDIDIVDADLVKLFDNGMDAGAWIDMMVERYPHIQEIADTFGRMAASCVANT